ncbi:MAG: response regulator transcription factor [Deltaproteobacteria bacterium]|nr:response regulator transcription factor [Deltaproteobacteria bacterium]
MRKIRLLLIEDNRLLREGLTEMIKKQRGLDLVGASEKFEGVLSKEQKLKPQVVLLDQCLRDQNSLHVAEIITKEFPETKVIVMGLIPVKADVMEFVKAGASGFILKDSTFDDFLKTIRSVAQGGKVLPLALTGSLFSQIVEVAVRNGKVQLNDVRITKREREIIDLISEGLSNKEIAQRLHLAPYTVKNHVHHILEKLALHSRLQIAVHARVEGSPKPSR